MEAELVVLTAAALLPKYLQPSSGQTVKSMGPLGMRPPHFALRDTVVEGGSIGLQAVFTLTSRSIRHESTSGFDDKWYIYP